MTGALVVAIYSIAYATLHSALASRSIKMWARTRFGPNADSWYRLVFNFVGLVTLLPLGWLLHVLPDRVLYVLPSPWRYVALAAQMATLLAFAFGLRATDVWFFLGLRQLFAVPDHKQCQPSLTTAGMYRWVRHPLYLLSMILMWLTPVMTTNLAAVFFVMTLYMVVGTFFEERRLVDDFGEAYVAYQAQVPRLLPWRGPVRCTLSAANVESDPTHHTRRIP